MASILLFGRFADLAGWRAKEMAVASVAELRRIIATDHPAIAEALADRRASVAVNQEVVRGDCPLSGGDEVALFPPFSGG